MAEDVFGLTGAHLDGRYRVERVVGEGGFAIVYRGTHTTFQKPVAIKCLKIPQHFTSGARARFMEKFREEAVLLEHLGSRHPHIVAARDYGVAQLPAGPVPYLVLEWLEGRSLAEVLRGPAPAMDEPTALALLLPVIEALAVAHETRVAHRDIKPENLFLLSDPPPRLKILDFGIAKVMQEGDSLSQQQSGTSSNFHAFSPMYGAPEQFAPKKFGQTGPWTDIHALGLVLIEMLTARRALQGDDYSDLLLASIGPDRPTLQGLGAPVSEELDRICSRMVATDPRRRPQSAGELLEELAPLGRGLQVSLPPGAQPQPSGSWAMTPAWGRTPTPSRPGEKAPASGAGVDALARTSGADVDALARTEHAPSPEPEAPTNAMPRGSPARGVLLGVGVAALAALGAAGLLRPTQEDVRRGAAEAVLVPAPSASGSAEAPPGERGAMVELRGGTFLLGSDDGEPRSRPAHEEILGRFWLDRTEVTVEAFGRCVAAGKCAASGDVHWDRITEEDRKFWGQACNWGKKEREEHPMNCVDWYQAARYCAWAGKRLPTEVEWEFAARGGARKASFPWGERSPDGALVNGCGAECADWFRSRGKTWGKLHEQEDGWPTTAPVGRFPALGQGSTVDLRDLLGNVWEWTASPYGEDYRGENAELPRVDCQNAAHLRCQGTAERVSRGGGWSDTNEAAFRAHQRSHDPATQRTSTLGFRCAWSPAG